VPSIGLNFGGSLKLQKTTKTILRKENLNSTVTPNNAPTTVDFIPKPARVMTAKERALGSLDKEKESLSNSAMK